MDPQNPSPQLLLNPHVPSYDFDVISGVTYQINITQPPRYKPPDGRDESAHRIVNLRYRGVPVTADQEFLVVTNNYRADSGGIIAKDESRAIVLRAPDQTRDVIVRYFLTKKTVDVQNPPVWSFAPISHPVNVTFVSSPAAAKYFVNWNDIVKQGALADGYEQFVLTL